MIGHEFDSGLNVEQVQGQAYVVDNDSRITPLQPGMQIAPNQVLLTNENSSLVVSHDGERYFVDSQCASCLVPLDDNQHGFASSAISATFNPDALDSDSAFDLDVAQLQNLIAQGVDPTEVFEEAAAGENAGSSNAGFIVVNYNYDSTLTEAGFDTLGPLSGDDTTEDFLGGERGGSSIDPDPISPTEDVDAAGGQLISLAVEEGDLDTSPYGTPDTQRFAIEAGTDRLLPGSLQIAPDALAALESELAQLTSGGEAIVFTRQTSVDANGVGTFILTGTLNGETLIELEIVATQNGNNLDITATLTQSGPLDHTSGSGTYIEVNGDRIAIDVPLQVADTGGDLMKTPATISLTSDDGAAPSLSEASVDITETLDSTVTNQLSSNDGIDLGSDTIASINFDTAAAEAAFAGITSHGQPTTVDTSVPGVITLYTDNGGTPEKILEISLEPSTTPGEAAEYQVTQYQPIDQHNASDGDADDDNTEIVLPFTVTDADGDVSNSSEITFNIKDGEVAQGGERLDGDGKEVDILTLAEQGTPNGVTTPVTNSVEGAVVLEAATDRLDPKTLYIDQVDALKAELEELKNNDGDNVDAVTVTESTDSDGNPVITILATVGGEPALEIVLTANQAPGELDINLETKLTQFMPLIHPQNPDADQSSGLVTADGERILVKVPVQVADTDGDLLVDPNDPTSEAARVLTFAVVDDDSATFGLGLTEPVRVNESSIDDGDSANQGSVASGTLNFDDTDDAGQPLTLDTEKVAGDTVTGFNFVTDYVEGIQSPNGDLILASGYPIFLEQRPETETYPKTYFGHADDGTGEQRDVFKVILNQDGTFSFELLSAIDHAPGDGENELTFSLEAFAVDADGDESGKITVPIIVTDDIPHTQGSLTMELDDSPTGAVSATIDVFDLTNPGTVPGVEDLSGADGTTFITSIFNGVEWVEVSTTRPSSVDIYLESDPSVKLGTVSIDPSSEPVGELTFTIEQNLANPSEVLTQNIKYEVTDFDGDKVQGEIALTINDQTPTITVAPDTGGDITGVEDQGQINTDTEDEGVNGANGIPINLQLNLGDNDLGEAYEDAGRLVLNGEVTLATRDSAGDIGGTFYFNGVALVPDIDGNIVLTSDMFEAQGTGEPLIFDLTGVTFVPDPDYSSYDGSDVIEFDVELEVNGHAPVTADAPMTITVEGVADVPTLDLIGEAADGVFELDEDHERFGADDFTLADLFEGSLQDTDGSETLRYEFTLSPDMGELLGGFISGSNGSYVLTDPTRLDQVRFVPDKDFSGDITLTIKAVSTESSPSSVDEASTETSVILRVEPQADDARLSVTRVFDNEDAGNADPALAEGDAISLADKISLTSLGTDTDGSESLFIRIYDIPDGAVLQLRDGATVTPLTDTDRISVDDISKLELIPPVHSNENFTLMVEGIVVDSAPNAPTDERIIPAEPLDVILTGVADTPEFEVENPGTDPGQWQVDATTGVLSTTVPEDGINGDGLVAVDFTVISGEKAEAPSDTSETLSMLIIDPPEGLGLVIKNSDGSFSDVELAFAGWQTDGSGMSVPSYSVDLAALNGKDVYLKLPPHTTEDLSIQTRLVATENDGDSTFIDTTIEVIIDPPVVDAADTYTATSEGVEDAWNTVNWQPDLTIAGAPDSTAQGVVEKVVGATISGFADTDSVRLNNGSDIIDVTPVGGEITLTEAQIEAGYQVQVKREEHSDVDLTLTTTVTVRQEDFEGVSQDEKVISGTVNVDIQAKVETEEGELQVLDGSGTAVTELTTDSKGHIDFNNAVVFTHPDTSSSEEIVRIVITDLAEGFYVTNAIYDGQMGWIVNDPNDFTIVAPANTPDLTTTTFTISAVVIDQGDAGEGDVSNPEVVSSAQITLNYQNTTKSPHEAYQVIVPTDPVVIEGEEDNPISLEALGTAINYPNGAMGDFVFDQVTIVISGDDIPPGTVIGGARYHIDNDTYVFEVPDRKENGNPYPDGLDLSGLTITPPDDYAGELTIPLTIVSVDTRSGDTETSSASVQLDVKPLVDLPAPTGGEQPSDNTLETAFELGVNGTSGLNDETPPQPVEPGDTEAFYAGQALEDGIISLNLSGSLADTDSVNGEETITSAILTVDPSMGVFVLPDDSETNLLMLDESELGDIRFKPAQDFSGEVTIDAQITITDTATTGTDSRDITTELKLDVTPVHDEVTFSHEGVEVADGDTIEIEATEDTGISLGDIGAEFTDIDGSESLASISIANVPQGFTLSVPAVNAGNGQWIIPASAVSDLSSLSEITLNPPKDFSGDVDIVLTVFTQEEGLAFIQGQSQPITVSFEAVADGASAYVESVVTGDEDTDIDIDMAISAKDDRDSLPATQPSGVSTTENAPETLLITISGVPDGGKIVLPVGVTGTVTPEISDGGDIVVTVDSTQLDGLTFVPPQDANGQFVLDLAIQTVDNGNESADVVNKQVTVNVTAINDAPVNILADSYEAEEDTVLTITDLAVQDVDALDGSGTVFVELAVGAGSMLDLVGDDLNITISGEGTNVLTLEGDLDAINALLAQGVNYQFAGENTSGDDTLTMTTRDRGNTGLGGQKFDRDTVSIVVAPKSDMPELSFAPQLASMRAATGALIPLLGLMASVVDPIDNEFTLTFSGLGTVGELVDGNGDTIGTDNGDGSWTFDQAELQTLTLADLNLRFSGQPAGDVVVTARSDVGDGDPKEAVLTIGVNIVDTTTTPVLNDTDNSADNLVVDDANNTQLVGGAGDDVLVGGLGEDILIGGAGDDEAWGGDIGGMGDGESDTFAWQSGDFGSAGSAATDTIKDFEPGIDVIDISDAFSTEGVLTFTDLANRLDIQTVGSDTHIQVFDNAGSAIQNITVEGHTLNELLGMDASSLTQDEVLESMLMAGQLVVFDATKTQFGTEADDVMTADDSGEQLFAGDGDDTLTGGLGDDILVGGSGDDTLTGGAGDDVFAWGASDVDAATLTKDEVTDFEVGDSVTGDKLDISALLPETVGSGSTIEELLDYIRPEVTSEGLTLHVSQTANGTEVQDIVLRDIGLSDLGLSAGATGTQILDELVQQQTLKLD